MYTRKPAKYDFCIIEKVSENFQPAKFSTDILMKTAASPVPESNQKKYTKTVSIKSRTTLRNRIMG